MNESRSVATEVGPYEKESAPILCICEDLIANGVFGCSYQPKTIVWEFW